MAFYFSKRKIRPKEEEETGEEQGGGGGLDPELIKSYLRFFRRAIRAHRLLMSLVLVVGVALTAAAYKYLPRTYSCTTILMVDGSQVLECGPVDMAKGE